MKAHVKQIHTIGKQLILLILPALTVVACSQQKKDEKQVTQVAHDYLTAFAGYHLEEAKKFGDESAVKFLDKMQETIAAMPLQELEEVKKQNENAEVVVLKVFIKSNTKAEAKYQIIKGTQVLQTDRLYLVKEDNQWKVHESIKPRR